MIEVEVFAIDMGGGKTQCGIYEGFTPTLSCTHAGEPVACYQEEKMWKWKYWNGQETTGTLSARNAGGGQRMPDKDNFNAVTSKTIVRRLTEIECERLQGFPDGWTDIGEWTDSKGRKRQTTATNRYKALGNSIALPYWKVLARRIAAQYDRDITMASLFDGIGGFPLAFEHAGAKAVWASEVEEFCIAVTKKHFPEAME